MESAFLLLGSNMGNKYQILQDAIEQLSIECGSVVSQSKIFESEPWGFEADGSFFNLAIEIETDKDPYELLDSILKIENSLGRIRLDDGKYHSRTIDIDIIFYGNRVIDSKNLIIPHPNMHLRRFVLLPLCEIAPDYIHPKFKIFVKNLLALCEDKLGVVEV